MDERHRWIGVDVGDARVGIAITDDGVGMALPHATVAADEAVREIVDLVAEHDAGIVIGWPLQLDGSTGRATRKVEVFIEKLETEATSRGIELTIEKRDERLTTSLAEQLLSEAGVYGKRRKQVVDQLAAVQILKAFLEERHGQAQ